MHNMAGDCELFCNMLQKCQLAFTGLLLPLSKALDLSLQTQPVEQQWQQAAERQQKPATHMNAARHADNSLPHSTGLQADPVS
jgi:hypothetical protein